MTTTVSEESGAGNASPDDRGSPGWAPALRSLRLGAISTALAAACTVPVAIANGDVPALLIVVSVAAVGAAVGWWGRDLPDPDGDRRTATRMAETAASWLALATFATGVTAMLARTAGPAAAAVVDPWGAVFEAVSGITTTGLSMVTAPADLSPTFQWWRTVLQVVGAAGVVVFALQVAEPSGDRGEELSAGWGDQPADDPKPAARRILAIFGGIAVLGFIGLVATGDPLWRSLNHALTAAATGGFAITDDSAAASGVPARVVLATVGVVSAMSYGTLWGVITRSGPPLWRRTQVRVNIVVVTVVGSTGVAFAAAAGRPVVDAVFNTLSASATSGFSAGNAHRLVPAVAVTTIIAMLIGGAAGSTAGGIKVARLGWIAKSMARWLPEGGDLRDDTWQWDGEVVEPKEGTTRIVGAGVLIAVWVVAVVVGTLILVAATPSTMLDSGFDAVSAASGTGLSSGLTGPDLAWLPKATLVTLMLGGRLEFTVFLALVHRLASTRSRST